MLAWDDAEVARAAVAPEMLTDLTKIDWSKIQALVMSPPGIPTHPKPHPVAAAARNAGCPIISDIGFYRSQPKARYVGVTGTNGKSTTTTLIHHILVTAGKKAVAGGNLGQAALSLEPMGPDGIYVLELSSYQLEITPSAICDIAIIQLNITPDHLERHGGMEGYIASKRLILAPKGKSSLGIVGIDDAPSKKLF